MPRPTDKTQLLNLMQKEHGALEKLIETLTTEQKNRASTQIETWAFKDVLVHVTAWEQMVLGWYRAGVRGETPHLPAPGFNWRQIPALNAQIYEAGRERPFSTIQTQFQSSFAEIKATIEAIDQAEMFTPEQYAWTNKNNMATYFISATSSHYAWAKKEIRKLLRAEA
ncbi:MAG: DfsB family protein [Chloroflexi bacterium]|nr:MAG: DfsB family protein [Chloroflexota bacterium]